MRTNRKIILGNVQINKKNAKIGCEMMYLARVCIRNFRCFDETGIEAHFDKGVNAVIGENNVGKSALIDALRIAFSTLSYHKEVYFRMSDFHLNNLGKPAEKAWIDVYLKEVPNFLISIWNPLAASEGEFHICFYTTKAPNGLERIKYDIWGGTQEENSLDAETLQTIKVAYLGALRDVETGMKPSHDSRMAALLTSVTNTVAQQDSLVSILKSANDKLLQQPQVQRVREIVNENLLGIEQNVLAQQVSLGMIDPKFSSIAAALRMWIKPKWKFVDSSTPAYQLLQTYSDNKGLYDDTIGGAYINVEALLQQDDLDVSLRVYLDEMNILGLELYQNGLGYNNLLYMSAILGDMTVQTPEETGVYCDLLLVEEPEAHLHPQLQRLVHNYFEQQHSKSSTLQVIYTSHSPSLVSQIGLDKINVIYEQKHSIGCYPLKISAMDKKDKAYLERFLDVTKSQLFFSKGVIFVEGISEALLVSSMAKLLNRPLDQFAVEVVDIESVTFKPFAQLLTPTSTLSSYTKAAIITDDDRCTEKLDTTTYISKDNDFDVNIDDICNRLTRGHQSNRCKELQILCDNSTITLCKAYKTLEYELAIGNGVGNIELMLDAIKTVHPKIGGDLETTVNCLDSIMKKAAAIWLFVQNRDKFKGVIAQALGLLLDEEIRKRAAGKTVEHPFNVPNYIKTAIKTVTTR